MLSFSDALLEQIQAAAATLRCERDAFLRDMARLLGSHPSDDDVDHVLQRVLGVRSVKQQFG